MHQKRLEEKYQNINNSNYFRIERLWAITLFLKLFYNKHVLHFLQWKNKKDLVWNKKYVT